ncbi:MAG: serine hydrolase domain-containing protein [Bryobacteraceae bacterium]
MRLPYPVLVASLAFLPVFVPAQSTADLDSKITAKVEAALKQSGAPSVSVAIVRDGKLVLAKAFGNASIDPHRPADAQTRYAIGSVSKEFTAAALLMLQQQGKLSLDDKVARYFPDLTRANEVSIRQLLTHTAGYEDYAPQDYIIPAWTKPTTAQAILDAWARKPLNFDPGTRWQYSNTNYVLAGEIFEKVSGIPLVTYLKQTFFDSLSMASAADCSAASPNDAQAYTRYGLGPARAVAREANGWYFAAGELCMTASDLAKWDIALLEKRFLSADSYSQFTHEMRLANGDLTHYALGLQLGEMNDVPTVSHGGEVSGFLASNTLFPTRGAAVVLLSNQDGISLIGSLSRQIGALLFAAESNVPSEKNTQQAKAILAGLQKGKINRSLFTDNANSYFTQTALADLKSSLGKLGSLKSVKPGREGLRGGMIYRSYRAEFAKKTVVLSTYVLPDGKFEQYLVEEQL